MHPSPRIAVLVTLDSKFDVAQYTCRALQQVGARPWLLDLSLRPHSHQCDELDVQAPLAHTAPEFAALHAMPRAEASQTMIRAGELALHAALDRGDLCGVIGVGGANGSTMACGMMRTLPYLLPKAMVTPVAATAAVQWYVAQSDIAMFPSIGDISLNRITRAILDNAARAIAGMSTTDQNCSGRAPSVKPLIGISTFGNLQITVDRITAALEETGTEVIHFHASGPGGRALESLARTGELQGIIDLTTSELADYVTGGVYSAGADRLTAAAQKGIPQVVVPGCLDFTNWWVGEVPDVYHHREFYQYNQEILLMRTNQDEFAQLGQLFCQRLAQANGPFRVLIPMNGFSQMTRFPTQTVDGQEVGHWHQPGCDVVFADTLAEGLEPESIVQLDLHINDPEFAAAAVSELTALMPSTAR